MYDLTPENYGTICSLLQTKLHEHRRRAGCTHKEAYALAIDDLLNLIQPATTAQELRSYLGPIKKGQINMFTGRHMPPTRRNSKRCCVQPEPAQPAQASELTDNHVQRGVVYADTIKETMLAWLKNNDVLPKAEALAHFTGLTPSGFNRARREICAELGFVLEDRGTHWCVVTRPKSAKQQEIDKLQADIAAIQERLNQLQNG